MRVRRIKFLKDRVQYALDKKVLRKIGWKDGDIVNQILDGNFWIMLCNKTLREREYGDYERSKEILDIIAERETKRQEEYRNIKKKYPHPNSKAYKQAIARFNRNYLTEEGAIGKKLIPVKKLKYKLKIFEEQEIILRAEINSLKKKIKRRIKQKASS